VCILSTKPCREIGGAAPLIFIARWRWVVSLMPKLIYLWGERVPITHWLGGWVDSIALVWMVWRRKNLLLPNGIWTPFPFLGLVPILTTMSQLLTEVSVSHYTRNVCINFTVCILCYAMSYFIEVIVPFVHSNILLYYIMRKHNNYNNKLSSTTYFGLYGSLSAYCKM